MQFHIEQRRAWLRTDTHTLVFDRGPDFQQLATNRSGISKRLLRIWVAEPGEGRPFLRCYLGCLGICAGGPASIQLARIIRRLAAFADVAGQPRQQLRQRLMRELRQQLKV